MVAGTFKEFINFSSESKHLQSTAYEITYENLKVWLVQELKPGDLAERWKFCRETLTITENEKVRS